MEFQKALGTLLATTTLTFASGSVVAQSGAELFKTNCMQCHKLEKTDDMIAPPIFGVVDHYKKAFPNKADFVSNMQQFLLQPDPSKTQMPGAVRRFQLMPNLNYQPEQAEAVASYLYEQDFTKPDWYEEHFKAEHGE